MKKLAEVMQDTAGRPFMVGFELVTTRGIQEQPNAQHTVQLAHAMAENGQIDWISITDNAGGNPMLTPDHIGRDLLARGQDVVIHLTCKDRNRDALEASAWAYAAEGLTNMLVLTGDYPIDGYKGIGAPVFDLDSTSLIKMLSDMNKGLKVRGRKPGSVLELGATQFNIGCAVSPFKYNEAEQAGQYRKMLLKYAAGANFIVPQLGYDMRKWQELKLFLERSGIDIPVFGNIYMLNKGVANIFSKDMIPGCTVGPKLLAAVKEAAAGEDKGKGFFKELAARQYAIFKGLGFRGAYLGGIEKPELVQEVIDRGEAYGPDDWKSFVNDMAYPAGGDYYFYQNADIVATAADPDKVAETPRQKLKSEVTGLYRFSRLFHYMVFDKRSPLYGLFVLFFKITEKRFKFVGRLFDWQEGIFKKAMYNCQDCGDCALFDCYYLCPMSQCAKNQRNGPCGGSKQPECEAKPGTKCIWYRAYLRARSYKELDTFLKREELIIRKNELRQTSSWANYFLGR